MRCPSCGASVGVGTRVCAACGAEVTDPGAQTLAIATQDALEQDELYAQLTRELARDYEFEQELGRGGMAVVYKATEIELRRPVAIKVLPPAVAARGHAERFKREARLAAALDHPSIIPIYRVGQAAGTYFFAMKFVEGRALDTIIEAQGALPLSVIVTVLHAAAGALAYAHERGIIHRDIKGGNLLVDREGRVLITDFGIARATQDKELTATGSLMGTPYFMSPEACAGAPLGPQSDQYSLGVLAFQMITGAVPFDADSLMGLMQHHCYSPVPDVRQARDGLPEPLVALVERALNKEPTQRYASTREMLAAVDAVPSGEPGEGEELLRLLAQGNAIAQVRTASLPPIPAPKLVRVSGTGEILPVAGAARRTRPWRRGLGLLRSQPVVGVAMASIAIVGTAALLLTRSWQQQSAGKAPAPVGSGPYAAAAESLGRPGAERPAGPASGSSGNGRVRPPSPAASASQPIAGVPQTGLTPGVLRLYTLPPTATIFVDGRAIGQGLAPSVAIAAGPHRLAIHAPGFLPFDTVLHVVPGRTLDLGLFSLKRAGS